MLNKKHYGQIMISSVNHIETKNLMNKFDVN
jgi:hypothetical protein